jgi:hypothetical protein
MMKTVSCLILTIRELLLLNKFYLIDIQYKA